MKIEELNPATPELDINGKTAQFKLFNLYHKAWAYTAFSSKEQPNGLATLAEGLRSLDKVIIARLAWRLIENKSEIGEEAFYSFAEKDRNVVPLIKVINQILELSQPTPKVNDRMKELKKS